MSVKGKTREDWVALTLTDFGDKTRRQVLRHHFTKEAAYRAWDGLIKIYGRPWIKEETRVWQETREGQILNDSAWS